MQPVPEWTTPKGILRGVLAGGLKGRWVLRDHRVNTPPKSIGATIRTKDFINMPDLPTPKDGRVVRLLNEQRGDLAVRGDLIEVPNAANYARETFQQLEHLAKTLHKVANQRGITLDVVSMIPSPERPGVVQVLVRPEGHTGDPRSFTLPRHPKPSDLGKIVSEMRKMLPSV